MIPILSAALFIFVLILSAFMGVAFWVRPKKVSDRISGVVLEAAPVTVHPSLVWHELVKRVGNLVPANPANSTKVQKVLMRAGIRNPSAIRLLYGAKVIGLVVFLAIAIAIAAWMHSEKFAENAFFLIPALAAAGFFAPNQWLRMKASKRQKELRRALPNALDLLVVCIESGLGLDQAIIQVAKELQFAHPELTEEFTMVNLELKAGKPRAEALRNLAQRTGVEELKRLVAILIQADRFGTSIAQSLRAHSEHQRIQTRQKAEEKAAKVGIKLVFPIFFCVLPSLFIVTVGPVIVRIMRDLLPMMNSM
jgi:tight adherence protein C